MANIYEKIQKVKAKLMNANIKKSGFNKFAGYNYYELADFTPYIIQFCEEEKLFTAVSFDKELAILRIVNIEKPDEVEVYTSPMEDLELKGCNKVQALGGVETYSRRYLYMSAFDIVENDMFDGVNDKEEKKEPKITKEQATVLINTLKAQGFSDEDIGKSLAKYKVKTAEELTEAQYAEILRKINKGA